jgi:hypothetical protein
LTLPACNISISSLKLNRKIKPLLVYTMINKIENSSGRQKLPTGTEDVIKKVLSTLPKEHLRGIDRIRLVDFINDPRLRNTQKNLSQLPGLYHPRQGAQPAWLEIALDVLLPQKVPVYKRLLPRLSYKANIAAVLFSLVGQHHYLTLASLFDASPLGQEGAAGILDQTLY